MTEEQKRILKTRAQALARKPVTQTDEAMIDVLVFSLATEHYGIETAWVREVVPFKDLTPVPCTPAFYAGIVNVRGRMIAVLDLKQFFDLPGNGLHDLHKIIILHSTDMDVGLLADDVDAVRSVPVSQLQDSLPTLTGLRAEYLKGVTGERLVVLDAAKLLADKKLIVQENA